MLGGTCSQGTNAHSLPPLLSRQPALSLHVVLGWCGSRANGSGILETSVVQKGDFTKARGQDPWAERATLFLSSEEWLATHYGIRGGKGRRKASGKTFIC